MNMTEREKIFYQNLIISDEDNTRIANYLKTKGIEKHILIKEKLLPWSESGNIEYTKVASTYRYDKRIRLVLFKYLSYLEEFYRAIILDHYINEVRQRFWITELRKKLKDNSNNLNDALEHLDFSSLLIQSQKLPKAIKKLCLFPSGRHLTDNFFALKELRNAVMHNKFLLLYRGFNECYVQGVDGEKSANLKANILNLIQFLPQEVGTQCKKDINDCNHFIAGVTLNACLIAPSRNEINKELFEYLDSFYGDLQPDDIRDWKNNFDLPLQFAVLNKRNQYYETTNCITDILRKQTPCGIRYSSCYLPMETLGIVCSDFNVVLYKEGISKVKFIRADIKTNEQKLSDVDSIKIVCEISKKAKNKTNS